MVSKKAYNNAREGLLNQQIISLSSLQAVYKQKIGNFLIPASAVPENELYDYVSSMFPAFNRPFQQTAAQLGQAFYTNRRTQAGLVNSKVPSLTTNIFDFDLSSEYEKLNPIGLITGLIINAKNQGNIFQAAGMLQQVTTKSVTNMNRRSILMLDEIDNFSTHKVSRRAREQGCSFCKTIIALIKIEENPLEASKFHNNCSCVVDTSFNNEPLFSQTWENQTKRDLEEAEKLIRNGEAGDRTVQVGSNEWKNSLKRELNTKARNYRKSRNYSPEKDRAVREIYTKSMNELVNKIARGNELTQIEKNNLYQWGVTQDRINPNLSTLRQPYAVSIDTLTTKNLAYTMEKNRKIIESKRPENILSQELN